MTKPAARPFSALPARFVAMAFALAGATALCSGAHAANPPRPGAQPAPPPVDAPAPSAPPSRPGVQDAAVESGLPALSQVLAEGEPIPPEAWRAMAAQNTLWYFAADGYWGREAYDGAGGHVVFEHRDGACLEGDWSWAEGLYCFDFADTRLHCFQHMRWRDRIFAVSTGGDVQEVKRIDAAPLSCGPDPMS